MRDTDNSRMGIFRDSAPLTEQVRQLIITLSLALALSLAVSQPAHAQTPAPPPSSPPPSEPTAAQRASARAWFSEGKRLYEQKDYPRALQHYQAAYRLVRIPSIGIEVAMAQAALRQWVEASATAVDVEKLPPLPQESADDARARAEAQKLLRHLAPRIPTLILSFAPADADARVRIDGDEMPAPKHSAMSYRLNPGSHRLSIVAHGYRTQDHGLDLKEREEAELNVTLIAEPTALAAPASPVEPPGAAGTLRAQPASVSRSDTADPGSSARTRGYVALGVAGAAAAVGTVTGILALTRMPDCPDDSCRPDQRGDADASERFGNVATVSFGVGIAAGAYGLWELMTSAPAPSAAPGSGVHLTRSRVIAERGGASFALSGAF